MKVAVTASGREMDSAVDARFGRASFFVVVDTESGYIGAHDNVQNLNAPQGAGIQAAQTVAGLGVEAVLTGHCGPKAFRVLSTAGIVVAAGASGTVADAVADFVAGRLQPLTSPDVEGHWQ